MAWTFESRLRLLSLSHSPSVDNGLSLCNFRKGVQGNLIVHTPTHAVAQASEPGGRAVARIKTRAFIVPFYRHIGTLFNQVWVVILSVSHSREEVKSESEKGNYHLL